MTRSGLAPITPVPEQRHVAVESAVGEHVRQIEGLDGAGEVCPSWGSSSVS